MRIIRCAALLCALTVGVFVAAFAQQRNVEGYDYFGANAQLINRGQQAFILCNGLFTSNRSLEDVYRHELQIRRIPLLHPRNGDVEIDRTNKRVTVGKAGNDPIPPMRAVYREGLGCIVLSPHQGFEAVDALPQLAPVPRPSLDAVDWPNGDRIVKSEFPSEIDEQKLRQASDWLFDPLLHGNEGQVTLSLLVVHKGQIVHERYENGADMTTKTRTWSAAKSIAVTLIGTLVDQGKLSLDAPLPIDWIPSGRTDPRREITLRHVLNMSSGLETVDNGREYVTGSGLAYWAGANSADDARSRGLINEPGSNWDYENYDTLLAMLAMKRAVGDDAYLEFPRKALFDKIGMHNTFTGVDRFGDFVMSSQVYTTARDLARFGLLYMNGGVWNGERIISKEWIKFCSTPSAANAGYGGQWWLPTANMSDIPSDTIVAAGNRGNYVIVVPS